MRLKIALLQIAPCGALFGSQLGAAQYHSALYKKHMVKVCGVWYNICNYLLLRRVGQQIAESESRNAENANRVMQNLKRGKEKESVSYKRLPFGS